MSASTPISGSGCRVEGCVEADAALMLSPASTDLEARQAVHDAQRVFARTLACWAGDLLELRSRGLHEAIWTGRHGRRRLRRAA